MIIKIHQMCGLRCYSFKRLFEKIMVEASAESEKNNQQSRSQQNRKWTIVADVAAHTCKRVLSPRAAWVAQQGLISEFKEKGKWELPLGSQRQVPARATDTGRQAAAARGCLNRPKASPWLWRSLPQRLTSWDGRENWLPWPVPGPHTCAFVQVPTHMKKQTLKRIKLLNFEGFNKLGLSYLWIY